jgi:hypothetical protein
MGSCNRKEDPPSERHRCAGVEMFSNHSKDRGSTMQVTTYGVDLAKRVFQVHWVEAQTGEVKRRRHADQPIIGAACSHVWGTKCGWCRRSSCARS